MTRIGPLLAVVACVLLSPRLCLAAPTAPLHDVRLGYLGLLNDPRYVPDVVYTGIELKPAGDPSKGAELGVQDLKVLAAAVGINPVLDEEKGADAGELIQKVRDMVASGERFIILDLPAELVDQVAGASRDLDVTLINTTAHEDFLRERCYPNLLHTAASDRQLSDALAQLLRTRNWTNVLVLTGPEDRDKELAASFTEAARRLSLNIVDNRNFTLAADPANRDKHDTLLVTGGLDYDVIYVADTEGEFSRYLPYATQLARPIIGSTGLTAAEWQWSWDRDGAAQLTQRLSALTNGARMSGEDWSTWIAAKAILTAYGKSHKTAPDDIDAFLKGPRLDVDGSKGVQMSFRSWDGQLRTPITLSTFNAVIGVAPFDGFEHENTTLDTLGVDEPEHQCK
jgi:ABC transporter substrate binding protein (PQQ-dependent alcohol dehydrogenase system)